MALTAAATAESVGERTQRQLQERERARCSLALGECLPPVVVFDRISLNEFDAWVEEHEGELGHWTYESIADDLGRVVVYEFPLESHSVVTRDVLNQIRSQVCQVGGLAETLYSQQDCTLELPYHRCRPSGALTPSTAEPKELPRLVIEVAYGDECLLLNEKLFMYMQHPEVQVVIGVKIPCAEVSLVQCIDLLRRSNDGNIVERREQVWAGCENSVPPISFPLGKLYHGTRIPTALISHQNDRIVIDLTSLANTISQVLTLESRNAQ